MNILVLSPCSQSKRFDPVVTSESIDVHSRSELVRKHQDSTATAAEMYVGREHQYVREAVAMLRENTTVEWHIVSAGFGLLHEEDKIPSYECGLSDTESVRFRAKQAGFDVEDMTSEEVIQVVGREMNIPQKLSQTLSQDYDLLFVVLREPYLRTVADALAEIPRNTTAIAFAPTGSEQLIGECALIPATETERQRLETTWTELRGKQLYTLALNSTDKALCKIQNDSSVARNLISNPP